MKNEKQAAMELHDKLTDELVSLNLALDSAHLWEPLKKQDMLCADIRHVEEKITFLEKRYRLNY